jgi:hypothetical protein
LDSCNFKQKKNIFFFYKICKDIYIKSKMTPLQIGLIVGLVIVLLIALGFFWSTPEPAPPAAAAPVSKLPSVEAPAAAPAPVIKPKPEKLLDCGYQHLRRGWYDAQGQGAKNDYCRFVGPGAGVPHRWFSCYLAGADKHITMPNELTMDPNAPHDAHDGSRGCPAGGANDPI